MFGRPPSCAYCVVKKRPLNSHHLSKCPWLSAATHSDLIQVLPKLCVGCLRIKPDGIHKCPPQFKEGGVSSHFFCLQCKCNVKLCKSPTTHNHGYIPETFVGAAVRLDNEEEEQASTWGFDSINKVSLGSSTLLTSGITLINGHDTIQINCLWDSGSESSFFSPALLPFATNQRQTSFKIETLSPSASKPEVVHGIEAAFQVAIPDGEVIQLSLLQHMGLQTRNMTLKPKVLTCSAQFAQKHDLKEHGLTEACSRGQHCHMRSQARLSIILGMDMLHWAPHSRGPIQG